MKKNNFYEVKKFNLINGRSYVVQQAPIDPTFFILLAAFMVTLAFTNTPGKEIVTNLLHLLQGIETSNPELLLTITKLELSCQSYLQEYKNIHLLNIIEQLYTFNHMLNNMLIDGQPLPLTERQIKVTHDIMSEIKPWDSLTHLRNIEYWYEFLDKRLTPGFRNKIKI